MCPKQANHRKIVRLGFCQQYVLWVVERILLAYCSKDYSACDFVVCQGVVLVPVISSKDRRPNIQGYEQTIGMDSLTMRAWS